MGGGDGTIRERKKKEEAEENEKGDKKNRALEWGSNIQGLTDTRARAICGGNYTLSTMDIQTKTSLFFSIQFFLTN